MNNHGRIHGQHKRVGKRGKSLMCMGNPSGPSGTSPARRRSFPADGQAMGSRALGHRESRIFAIDTGFLSKKHGCLAGKLFFFPDSLIASGVCINGCAVCINATGVSTDATGDYRFSRRKLDFFSHKNNFISFLHPFFPHYGIRSLMSFARNAFSKINERPKPVLSPLNFYCPNFVPSKAVVQIESGK